MELSDDYGHKESQYRRAGRDHVLFECLGEVKASYDNETYGQEHQHIIDKQHG